MIVKMKCPQCGAPMEIDDQQEQAFCSYCGTKVANLKEKVEITQNVNVSGTVRHVMDRSTEPNLYISYATAVPTVVMVVRIVDTGTKNTYLNGQTQSYHLTQGEHTIVLKIGKKNYNRTIVIPADNSPVRINAAYTGKRAEITIDQPPILVTDPASGQQVQKTIQSNNKHQSALAIISFILSFIPFLSFAALLLAILDLILRRKDKNHKHGLAIAALIIGTFVSIGAILSMSNVKEAAASPANSTSYTATTNSGVLSTEPEKDQSSALAEKEDSMQESASAQTNTEAPVQESASTQTKTGTSYEIVYTKGIVYTNSIGTTWIQAVVQIQNTGSDTLYIGNASVDIENADGKLLKTLSLVSVYPDVLKPNETALLVEDTTLDEDPGVKELTVIPHLEIKRAKIDCIRYPVSDESFSTDTFGDVQMIGRVENNTTETKSLVYVVVNLYDADHHGIGQLFTILTNDLNPGEKIGFTLSTLSSPESLTIESIASYEVFAFPLQFQF